MGPQIWKSPSAFSLAECPSKSTMVATSTDHHRCRAAHCCKSLAHFSNLWPKCFFSKAVVGKWNIHRIPKHRNWNEWNDKFFAAFSCVYQQLSIRHFGPSSAIWVSGSTPTFGVAPCVGPQVERSGSFDTWWNLDQQSGDPEILEMETFWGISENWI